MDNMEYSKVEGNGNMGKSKIDEYDLVVGHND